MNATLAEMAVVGRCRKIVTVEQTHEPAEIIAQPRRRNGGVLRSRPGARMSRHQSPGAESRLAKAPDRMLLGRRKQRSNSRARADPPRLGGQPLGGGERSVSGIRAQLDDQE